MGILNRPNRVIEHQRLFQAHNSTPLWLKGPRDRLFAYPIFVAIALGLTGALYGTTKMARGQK